MNRVSQIAFGFMLILGVVTWGQSFSGKIAGVVTDSSAGVVPRVSVTVVSEDTGSQRHVTTDASGVYVAAELPVGYYTMDPSAGTPGSTPQPLCLRLRARSATPAATR